jgi:hypothetical protein
MIKNSNPHWEGIMANDKAFVFLSLVLLAILIDITTGTIKDKNQMTFAANIYGNQMNPSVTTSLPQARYIAADLGHT